VRVESSSRTETLKVNGEPGAGGSCL
jgi:hypothetical protein